MPFFVSFFFLQTKRYQIYILLKNQISTTKNSSETYVDIHKEEVSSDAVFVSEHGNMEFYVFGNSSIEEFYRKL